MVLLCVVWRYGLSAIQAYLRGSIILWSSWFQRYLIQKVLPISLCNVSYKTITKVIVDQLKTLLPTIIAPTQCNFVPRRQIINNIVILQEVIHSMQRKKEKRRMFVVKVYLKKTFDRLKWDFFRDALHAVQLLEDFVVFFFFMSTSPLHSCK